MNTTRTKRAGWPLALLATAFLLGCQEQGSSPVEPEGPGILLNKDGNHPHGGGSGGDSGESATVELDGGYSTDGIESAQDISFQENGRRVVVRTEDGAQIDYSIDITLDFNKESCVWSGFADDDPGPAARARIFWDEFKTKPSTLADDQPRNLLFRVNKKENTFSDGEHRTEARWWVETTERIMYLVKVGVPGKVLADQLSELTGSDFKPAFGTFDDGTTKTVTITGGAVRLSRHECGAVTGATAGCGPQAPTLEVACINPTDMTGEFIATVKIP